MSFTQLDVAVATLSEQLRQRGYQYRESIGSDGVSYYVDTPSGEIRVWFDVRKQLYGYDTLSNGVKTGHSVDGLMNGLAMYLNIIGVLQPAALKVAAAFEKEFNVQSVYQKFVGQAKLGYEFLFADLTDKTKGFRIRSLDDKGELFNAMRVSYNHQNQYVVEREVEYRVSGDKVEVNHVDYAALYGDSEYVQADENTVLLCVDTFNGVFQVANDGLLWRSGNYQTYVATPNVTMPPLPPEELAEKCVSMEVWNPIPLAGNIQPHMTGDSTARIGEIDYEVSSNGEALVLKGVDGVFSLVDEDEFNAFVGARSEEKAVTNSEVKEVVEPVSNLVKEGETLMKRYEGYVRVIHNGQIYDMQEGIATKFGLPLARIKNEVEFVERGGMTLSTDELELKTFAQDVSEYEDTCKDLIFSIFE